MAFPDIGTYGIRGRDARFRNLRLTGTLTADGAVSFAGSFTFGDVSTDVLTLTGSLQAGVTGTHLTRSTAGNVIQSYVDFSSTTGSARNIIAESVLTGTTTGTSLYSIRGYAEIGTGCTVNAGAYIAGGQSKFKLTGTLNHADSRVAAHLVQMDLSAAGTYTAGQLSAIWIDCGATSAMADNGGQFYIARITNTTAASPDGVFFVYATADYLFDLGGPGGSVAWIVSGAVGGSQDKKLKIKLHGTDYYIAANTA
jgi:hypothetical protein